MSKNIVIVGASYVGLAITHRLLKYTLNDQQHDYKVVVVSPTTHHYWNMASVRAIVPGQFSDDKLFAEIPAALSKYGDKVEFVHGTAKALDTSSQSIILATSKDETQLHYDILVIATGSRAKGSTELPWYSSALGYEATRDILHKYQEKVINAKSIVISGGGPTGVESAGELGYEFGKTKEIYLITAGSKLLSAGTPAMATNAENELRKLQVKIVFETKVTDAKTNEAGQTTLTLSNGETKTVDLYLPSVGSVVNSDFVPDIYLNETKEIKVDEYLRVKETKNVWAAGDVIDIEPPQYVYAEKQAAALYKNLNLVINGKQPIPYRPGPPILGVTLGRSKATGRLGPLKLPSIVLWFAKGRTLGTQDLQPLVSGSKF
ncbi:BgTH12-06796 [Blumeria graminis f. sp. triticale]|nr:BgTH12-06796 [Blumeria graminis f. sp. triticale]